MKSTTVVALLAWLFGLASAKAQDESILPLEKPGDELTYAYHSHTQVIGQKDFEITGKVSLSALARCLVFCIVCSIFYVQTCSSALSMAMAASRRYAD